MMLKQQALIGDTDPKADRMQESGARTAHVSEVRAWPRAIADMAKFQGGLIGFKRSVGDAAEPMLRSAMRSSGWLRSRRIAQALGTDRG